MGCAGKGIAATTEAMQREQGHIVNSKLAALMSQKAGRTSVDSSFEKVSITLAAKADAADLEKRIDAASAAGVVAARAVKGLAARSDALERRVDAPKDRSAPWPKLKKWRTRGCNSSL